MARQQSNPLTWGSRRRLYSQLLGVTLCVLLGAVTPAAADPKTSPAIVSESFLSHHPDIRWRNKGIELYDRGEYEAAINALLRSARFADKESQALLAEMYWEGLGAPANRPLAYAWMDLAAERGYAQLLAVRERYWSTLSEAERDEALRLGQDVYATYGDEVAKPRLAKLLKRARREVTGSRVGFAGALQITVRMPGGGFYTMTGHEYYAEEYWKPELYFDWRDQSWMEAQEGRVEIGPLESAD